MKDFEIEYADKQNEEQFDIVSFCESMENNKVVDELLRMYESKANVIYNIHLLDENFNRVQTIY